MNIYHIYEKIDFDESVRYQIKVKGDYEQLQIALSNVPHGAITRETTGTDYQIYMFDILVRDQNHSYEIESHLHKHHLTVVSKICVEVLKNAKTKRNKKPPAASSRSA